MMLHGRLRRARLREPPLVPMINIVFLLLLYFMLAGSLNEKQLGVLPPISTSENTLEPAPLFLVADVAGNLTLEQREVDRDELVAALSALNLERESVVVQFAADQDTPSEVLYQVIGAAQAAGIVEIEILTRQRR